MRCRIAVFGAAWLQIPPGGDCGVAKAYAPSRFPSRRAESVFCVGDLLVIVILNLDSGPQAQGGENNAGHMVILVGGGEQ